MNEVMKMKTLENTKPQTIPYTMSLGNGQTLFINLQANMVDYDPLSGEMYFTPDGIDHLDKIRALAITTPEQPTPGYLQALRKALGLTQTQMAKKLRLSTISIKRWETGSLRPGPLSVRKLRRLVENATQRGVVVS
jgi:DNA-binding transcriptional regulator YiaG